MGDLTGEKRTADRTAFIALTDHDHGVFLRSIAGLDTALPRYFLNMHGQVTDRFRWQDFIYDELKTMPEGTIVRITIEAVEPVERADTSGSRDGGS